MNESNANVGDTSLESVQGQTPTTLINDHSPQCLFLTKLPLEVRRHIYGYLLRNPDLGTRTCITIDEDYNRKFRLRPAILLTCHQICSEATPILYKQNTFLIMFSYGKQYSALDRYRDTWKPYGPYSKVTRWRVMISPHVFYTDERNCRSLLAQFCRAIGSTELDSLEVLSLLESSINLEPDLDLPFEKSLEPLKILRNVKSVVVRNATFEETPWLPVPLRLLRPIVWKNTMSDSPEDLEVSGQFKDVITGNSFVQCLDRMHDCLVHYVASFESRLQAREAIEQGYISALYKEDETEDYSLEFLMFDVFTDHTMHQALSTLHTHILYNNIDAFKLQRKEIIDYLEPHYEGICEAATRLGIFLEKDRLGTGGPLSTRVLKAQMLLEELGNAIMDGDTARTFKAIFKKDLPSSELEKASGEQKAGEKKLELPSSEYRDFLRRFPIVADHYYARCDEIRKARAMLYECDLGNQTEPDLFGDLSDYIEMSQQFDLPPPSTKTISDGVS
ncbi:hypothetical protein HYFRA_00008834 [Hymenoscyphus fraxineus]|uniref:F-box domain-containing protein n=1 Tax=Hymenoscyphus fraxineus TaxID=746836 RepID=A0A9N9KY37_9HELO|nr:hypothetical protein HYFRA_00008834 [Hymenoscyphus fraxineus]